MSHLKAAGALAAGFVICALLIPTGALSAAPSLVGITDKSGTRFASVDKAHQLLAAESDPANAVAIRVANTGNTCNLAYLVPTGKALVVKTAVILGDTSAGATGVALLDEGPFCEGGVLVDSWLSSAAGGGQTASEDLGSQLVIPQGTEIDLKTTGFSNGAQITLYGYLIPAAAAPAGSRIIDHGVQHSQSSV